MANASQVSTYDPWGTASPYLTDILGRAQSLYGQQAPLYANPAANFGYGQATGAVGSALGGNTTLGGMASQISPIASGNISSQFANPFGTTGNLDATGAIRQALSGMPDYSAVNGALDAANTQQWNQFYNQVIPQLNQRASFLGNPSGAIKDLNSAITQIGQNQNLNAQQAYLGQYNLAKQQQQAASSLVANGGLQGQSNALGLGGLAGNLAQGTGAQSLTAAQLFPGISTLPQQNLSDYASIVGNTAGRYGTQTQTINPSTGQTIANVLGGLTAGAGLYNSLFPQSGGGAGNALLGGLGKLLGSGSGTPTSQQQINDFLASLNSSGGLNGNDFTNLDLSNDGSILGNYGTYGSNGFANTGDSNLMNTDFSSASLFGNTFDQSLLDQYNYPSTAGGEAATPTLSNIQTTSTTPAFDAYQATNNGSSTAATPSSSSPTMGSMSSTGSLLGAAGAGIGIANGVRSGTPTGYAGAGIGATKLAASNNAFGSNSGSVNSAAGGASNALGIYTGLKQGGALGDTTAAVNAAQLASRFSSSGILGAAGTAAGYVAAPLAVYSAVKNYESGKTGSDTLQGAEAGAAIGSIIPGIGTVVGGVVGAAVGAIASAFGPGAKDPETAGVQKLIDTVGAHPDQSSLITAAVQNPYIAMAGLMDRRESTLPMYSQYGRMGEQKFTNDMVGKINQAVAANPALKNDPGAVYSQVIAPWVNSMGNGYSKVGDTYKATTQGLVQQMVTQYMNGTAAQNWKAIGGDSPFSGIYNGSPFTAVPAPPTVPIIRGQKIAKAGARLN